MAKSKATVYKVDNAAAAHPIMKRQKELLDNASKDIKKSKTIEDEGSTTIGQEILDPPYDNSLLMQLCDQSSILQQCIDAYKVNIAGFGLESQSKVDMSILKEAEKKQVEEEMQKLNDYLSYINLETPIEEVIEAVEDDMEKTGNGYIEILRSVDGGLSTFEYLPAENMRICKKDKESQEITREVEINGKMQTKTTQRTFRKYVQVVGFKKVYFKEYGHPLELNYETGKYENDLDFDNRASEILHFKIGNDTYGKPRWIGNVINAVGARKAEELNYYYFHNGRHLPAAISVSNGQLDEESRNQLEDYMKNAQGVENAFKFLLLEAMGDEYEDMDGSKKTSNAKIEIKDLAQIIQQDALFLDYDDRTRKKIRSSFRLPPLYTGESQEYSRATADTAREITEEQVFQPERKKIARRLNAVLLPELEITKARLVFKNADFRDPVTIAAALPPFIEAGAVGPNDLRPLLGEVLGEKLEQWEEVYDRPITLNVKRGSELIQALQNGDIQKSDDRIVHILKDLRDYLQEQSNE